MTRKKQIKPSEKVGLTLTHGERMLLLNVVNGLTEEIRDVMRATPTAQPVMLTLDDLVSLFTKPAMNLGHALRTIAASSDSSMSTQRGGRIDGCIPATKPGHAS